jgi:putative flippase GtrA
METCYKVFRREVLQSFTLKERRFGFEPEVVAAIARARVRVVEMGISYFGRTYEEGKKIGLRDAFRALYCIVRYNAFHLPAPLQFLLYASVASVCAVTNLIIFLGLLQVGTSSMWATPIAFAVAAALNYFICVLLLFRHQSRWNRWTEVALYIVAVTFVGIADWSLTLFFLLKLPPWLAKSLATVLGLVVNYGVRRILIFPEKPLQPWRRQNAPN